MKIKKLAAAVIAVIICGTFSQTAYCEDAAANVNVYPSEDHKNISPYIYGVNSGVDLNTVSAKSFWAETECLLTTGKTICPMQAPTGRICPT